MNDFVTSFIGHLENIRSMIYADSLNVGMFHSTIPKKAKSRLLMTPPVFPRRLPPKWWEAVKLIVANTASPECPFFTWKLKCIIGDKSRQWFSLKWQTHLIQFGQNILQTPKSENSRFFGFSVFYFKRQLSPKRAFAPEHYHMQHVTVLCVLLVSSLRILRKHVLEGREVIRMNFAATSRTFLGEKAFSPERKFG